MAAGPLAFSFPGHDLPSLRALLAPEGVRRQRPGYAARALLRGAVDSARQSRPSINSIGGRSYV